MLWSCSKDTDKKIYLNTDSTTAAANTSSTRLPLSCQTATTAGPAGIPEPGSIHHTLPTAGRLSCMSCLSLSNDWKVENLFGFFHTCCYGTSMDQWTLFLFFISYLVFWPLCNRLLTYRFISVFGVISEGSISYLSLHRQLHPDCITSHYFGPRVGLAVGCFPLHDKTEDEGQAGECDCKSPRGRHTVCSVWFLLGVFTVTIVTVPLYLLLFFTHLFKPSSHRSFWRIKETTLLMAQRAPNHLQHHLNPMSVQSWSHSHCQSSHSLNTAHSPCLLPTRQYWSIEILVPYLIIIRVILSLHAEWKKNKTIHFSWAM